MSFFDTLLEKGLTAIGDVQFQTRPPLVTAADCRVAMRDVHAGDILLRKYNFYLDSFLIPGEYTHSGIVESPELQFDGRSDSPSMIIHAVAEGIERIDLLDFLKNADGFAILRPHYEVYYNSQKAIEFARMQIGKPYDFHFNVEADLKKVSAFFCHKLTAAALAAGGVEIVPTLKTIGPVTHEVFLADQFLTDARIKTIYKSN